MYISTSMICAEGWIFIVSFAELMF